MRIPEEILWVEDYLYKAKENNSNTTQGCCVSEDEMELELEIAFLSKRLEKLPMNTLRNIPAIIELLEYEKKMSYDEGYNQGYNECYDDNGW